MFDLNLPAYDFKMRTLSGQQQIFDELRRKFVALTPEEWVRQNVSTFLIRERQFPAGRMVHEASLSVNGQSRRCDALVYNANLQPIVLVEYKAPNIALTQKVFNQIAAYNFTFRVNYLIISNGMSHYCCKMDFEQARFEFLSELPSYQSL